MDRVPVLIVDDQETYRVALRAVLARLSEFELIGEATSGEEAVDLVADLRPALVLMDINMGGIDGLEATARITGEDTEVVVVLVSTYTAEQLPPHARTCGAAAYINKDELSPRLVRRIWSERGDPTWLNASQTST